MGEKAKFHVRQITWCQKCVSKKSHFIFYFIKGILPKFAYFLILAIIIFGMVQA
jgi:hypothetical protein